MGYSHYWDGQRPPTDDEWRNICVATRQLIANNPDIPVAWESEYDGTEKPFRAPTVTEDLIRFNGLGDDGAETFLVDPTLVRYDFCKTYRRPYDTLVVAVLALMGHYAPGAWTFDTDGDPDELQEGLRLAAGAAGEPVKSPFPEKK